MISFAVMFMFSLFIIGIGLFIISLHFSKHLTDRVNLEGVSNWPKVTIALSIRGKDKCLNEAMESIAALDYPNYKVKVVVDHPDDHSWPVIQNLLKGPSRHLFEGWILRKPLKTCSLKCSAIVEILDSINDDTEVVAFVDADTVVHKTWLKEMVGGLADKKVGVVFGNRWVFPEVKKTKGLLFWYLWNFTLVIFMHYFKIPWGGTFALRKEVIDECDIKEHWSKCIIEDVTLKLPLLKNNYKIKFLPQLIVQSHGEDVDVKGYFGFISRQFLWLRLYDSVGKWTVMSIVYGIALFLTGAFIVQWVSLFMQNYNIFFYILAGQMTILFLIISSVVIIEKKVRRVFEERGQHLPSFTAGLILQLLLIIPIMTHVHLILYTICLFTKSVEWRGIKYDIQGPLDVKRLNYTPFITNHE